MKIKCKTLFDITFTGVTGRFSVSAIPFKDRTGREIKNIDNWNFARNQQRNYETLLQLLSLRTQPMNISNPKQTIKVLNIQYTCNTKLHSRNLFKFT